MTQQNETHTAIKLNAAQTKRWKNAAERALLEDELFAEGATPGMLVRDAKNSVLGRLTGGQVHDVPTVAGGMGQPAQRAGAPHHGQQPAPTFGTVLSDTRTMQQPAQLHPPRPAPPAEPPASHVSTMPPRQAPPVAPPAPAVVPGPVAKRAAFAVAEELRAARALEAEAKKLGEELGIVGTGAKILAAVRIRLTEQERELSELEEMTAALLEADAEETAAESPAAADTEPPPPIAAVEPSIDGD
jgi:hypothetical protein